MMLPSHLLASLLLGLLLARRRPLARREWGLALGFGVLVDLDHLLQLPRYLATEGWDALAPGAMLAWGSAWQGFLHTPWALPLVLGAALLARSWIPPLFWALHMTQDFLVARHYVPFGSPLEWAIVAALAGLVLLALQLGRGSASLLQHARRVFALGAPTPRAEADAIALDA